MKILDKIKDELHVPKKGIVEKALLDYFYKHFGDKKVLDSKTLDEFLSNYLEGG